MSPLEIVSIHLSVEGISIKRPYMTVITVDMALSLSPNSTLFEIRNGRKYKGNVMKMRETTAPIDTDRHRSTPIDTDRHRSTPIGVDRHRSTPIDTDRHRSTPIDTDRT